MIIIGLGANVPSAWGEPAQTVLRALDELNRLGLKVEARSRLYLTTPYGVADQPTFVNAVARISASLPAEALLIMLKTIEAKAGRRRTRRWGPRVLDLDILDYKGLVRHWHGGRARWQRWLSLPHAEMHNRPFVLRPLMDVAPWWHHPVLGVTAPALLRRLPLTAEGRVIETLDENRADRQGAMPCAGDEKRLLD